MSRSLPRRRLAQSEAWSPLHALGSCSGTGGARRRKSRTAAAAAERAQPERTWPSGVPAETAAAASATPCRGRGCPLRQAVRGLQVSGRPSGAPAGRTLVSARAAPTLAGLTSEERTARLPACGRNCRSRRADGRSRPPPVCGDRPVRSTVRRQLRPCPARPTGRLPRCSVSAMLAEPRPVSGRRCPLRTLPQSAGVRGYRKRSPGRRPLVGCSHRRYAWPT
jgi:hypothetical protein